MQQIVMMLNYKIFQHPSILPRHAELVSASLKANHTLHYIMPVRRFSGIKVLTSTSLSQRGMSLDEGSEWSLSEVETKENRASATLRLFF
jgi:hypothetical protein